MAKASDLLLADELFHVDDDNIIGTGKGGLNVQITTLIARLSSMCCGETDALNKVPSLRVGVLKEGQALYVPPQYLLIEKAVGGAVGNHYALRICLPWIARRESYLHC
jgi:hypothetical protein